MIPAQSQWQQFGDFIAAAFLQGDRAALALRIIGQPGECQHLRDQSGGPFDALAQVLQRLLAFARVSGLHSVFGVDFQHRQRSAQFMRRVGNKALFAGQQLVQLFEHAVERRLHRFQLAGQITEHDGLQAVRLTQSDQPGQLIERLEARADGKPHQQHHQRNTQQVWHQRAAHDLVDQLAAHIAALAHPDRQPTLVGVEHVAAPLAVVLLQIGKARLPVGVGQLWHVERAGDHGAAGVADLKGQLALVAVAELGVFAGGFQQCLGQLFCRHLPLRCAEQADQHPRALPQLSVKQLFDLVGRVVVACPTHDQGADDQQAEHPNQNALADGFHASRSIM